MTLNIPLVDGWKIRSDKYNIILESDKQELYFYSTIQNAIESFLLKRIREFDAQSISELQKEIISLNRRLNQVLEPFKMKVIQESETKDKQEKLA